MSKRIRVTKEPDSVLVVRRLIEWAGSKVTLARVAGSAGNSTSVVSRWEERGISVKAALLLHVYGIIPATLSYPELDLPPRSKWIISDLHMPFTGAKLKGLPSSVVLAARKVDPFAA